MATVHGLPAIYERGRGLGFGYKWLARRVSLKGLYGRDRLQVLHDIRRVNLHSLGDHNFGGGGTVNGVIGPACRMIKLISGVFTL